MKGEHKSLGEEETSSVNITGVLSQICSLPIEVSQRFDITASVRLKNKVFEPCR